MGFGATEKDLAREQRERREVYGLEQIRRRPRGRRPTGDDRTCRADGCRNAGHYAGYCTGHFGAEIRRRVAEKRRAS